MLTNLNLWLGKCKLTKQIHLYFLQHLYDVYKLTLDEMKNPTAIVGKPKSRGRKQREKYVVRKCHAMGI